MAAPNEAEREAVQLAINGFEADSKPHDIWANKVDRWYRAWRGVQERQDDERNRNFQPRYAFQIIDTLVGGSMDPNPFWRVKPRQRMTTPEELTSIREGAKALEIVLAAQRDTAGFLDMQPDHRLQGLIAGMTVWKTGWSYAERVHGKGAEQEREVTQDDPWLEVVDVRDWIPHESARDMKNMKRCTHRTWPLYEELEELQKHGIYKNVSQIKETSSYSQSLSSREESIHSVDRTKDRVEVLECWVEGGKRVITVANRSILLRDRESPFDHKQFPFIPCGPINDLFRMQGVSVVELVEELQEMLWHLQNTAHDSLDYLTNLVLKVREGSTFSDLVFAPGEQWLMDDLGAVEALVLPEFPASVSLQREGLIKADIQNIPGASPALLGQSESTEQTATEVGILTNLAQRCLAAQKYQFKLADKAVGEQWIKLNKQFLDEDRYFSIVGEDGEEGWELVHPEVFAPYEWKIEIEPMDASLLKQERIAEAQTLFQVGMAALNQMAIIGQPLSARPLFENLLEAHGITDTARFFSAAPQPPQPEQQGGGGMPPIAPPNGNGGMTNPQLAAGPMSPSNEMSLSPENAMQQLLSGTGGLGGSI